MKEIRYWEAEDGTKFEYEDECQEYEEKQLFIEMLKVIPCYDTIFVRVTGEDEQTSFDSDDICYILIPDNADDSFFETLRDFDSAYFEGLLPYNEAKSHNDLLYWDKYSNSWRVWSKDHANLEILANHFQLFGEGE